MAITLMAAPMAIAQKVNKEAIVAKLAKADSDSHGAAQCQMLGCPFFVFIYSAVAILPLHLRLFCAILK